MRAINAARWASRLVRSHSPSARASASTITHQRQAKQRTTKRQTEQEQRTRARDAHWLRRRRFCSKCGHNDERSFQGFVRRRSSAKIRRRHSQVHALSPSETPQSNPATRREIVRRRVSRWSAIPLVGSGSRASGTTSGSNPRDQSSCKVHVSSPASSSMRVITKRGGE